MATGAYKTKLLSDHAAGRRDTRASAGHALAGALGFLRACHGRRRKHQRQHALSHVPGVTVTDNICAPYLSNFLSFFVSLSLYSQFLSVESKQTGTGNSLSLSQKQHTHTIVPVHASKMAFGRTFYFDSFEEERYGSNTVGPQCRQ